MSFAKSAEVVQPQGRKELHHSLIGVSRFPTTPGQCIQLLKRDDLWSLPANTQQDVLLAAKEFEQASLRPLLDVRRSGLAYNGFDCIQLTPMHGLSEKWQPVSAGSCERSERFRGFLWTKDSAHMDQIELDELHRKFCEHSGLKENDLSFSGDDSDDNLFARLVRGEIPQWRVWQDDNHIAFLTPFGNTPGYTVVVPRKHLSSDILGLDDGDFKQLMAATRKVVEIIKGAMGCKRVGMFFEGFEIDYAHVKLVPVLDGAHGSVAVEGPSDEYHKLYPGYLSTRLGPEADPQALEEIIYHLGPAPRAGATDVTA
ncbi:HIT-like protein [Myriangium duriaei CBS 260.36]|uniref:HIT-like protein n=1 Tax=Myriangium duriaei CBS 260.36 TaxID=1168546 RepID=A0A9P4IRN9_9PEZI|nr:HIT-like protein [Myriangium duriaei CBS 260.36]